ncbi:hypothetical protein ADL03_14490 [Nocardia sp. NRRL S-836]|nr:hypothetical protein ADL03_14490 [Nocardia sp. NRRL S-836]
MQEIVVTHDKTGSERGSCPDRVRGVEPRTGEPSFCGVCSRRCRSELLRCLHQLDPQLGRFSHGDLCPCLRAIA